MKLITDEKALNLAVQLLQNDKDVQEQLLENDSNVKTELEKLIEQIKEEMKNKASTEDLQESVDDTKKYINSALTIKEF